MLTLQSILEFGTKEETFRQIYEKNLLLKLQLQDITKLTYIFNKFLLHIYYIQEH